MVQRHPADACMALCCSPEILFPSEPESGRPLKVFDIVGFSLQYELSFTNVLQMLELGGIPLYAKDRA